MNRNIYVLFNYKNIITILYLANSQYKQYHNAVSVLICKKLYNFFCLGERAGIK